MKQERKTLKHNSYPGNGQIPRSTKHIVKHIKLLERPNEVL